MKKLILIAVMMLGVMTVGAQKIVDDWGNHDENPLNYRMWIDLSHHSHKIGTISYAGDMNVYLDVNRSNVYYLSIEDHYKAPMKRGQHLYIKFRADSILDPVLGDNNILDLVCEGYNYHSSYFKLSDNDVYLLMTHDIMKLRLELDIKYIDPKFKIKGSSVGVAVVELSRDYEQYKARMAERVKDAERQKQMKTNPLYDF